MRKIILSLFILLGGICSTYGQSMPTISSEDSSNETWYTIRFLNGLGGIVQDMGDEATLKATLPSGNEDQLWKVVQAKDGENNPIANQYVIVAKSGRKMHHNGDRFVASSTNSVNIILDTQSGYYGTEMIIRIAGGDGMHQLNALDPDPELAAWGNFEWASVLVFGPPVPKISTDSYKAWYYMQFQDGVSSGNVLTYKGEDANLTQEAYVDKNDNQLWKVIGTGTQGDFIIENKSGAKITVLNDGDGFEPANNRYQASKTGTAVTFNFNANNVGVDWWAVKNKTAATWKAWLSTTSAIDPAEVCEGEQHLGTSALKFVFVTDADDISTNIEKNTINNKANVSVEGNVVKILSDDFQSVSVYAITGQQIYAKSNKNEVTLPNAGCYILSIEYSDGSINAVKVLIK